MNHQPDLCPGIFQQVNYKLNCSQLPSQHNQKKYNPKQTFIYGNNIFQKLFACWVSPILQYGFKNILTVDQIPELRQDDKTVHHSSRIQQNFYKNIEVQKITVNQKSCQQRPNGWKLIDSIIKSQILSPLIFFTSIVFLEIIQLSILYFTHELIQYIQNGEKSVQSSIEYFIIFILINLVQFLFRNYQFYYYRWMDTQVSASLELLIFKKVLKCPLISSKQYDLSSLVSLSQIDLKNFQYVFWFITYAFSGVLHILFCIVILYYYVGVITLICVAFILLLVFVSYFLMNLVKKSTDQFYNTKDKTLKIVQQIIRSIKFIKFNSLQKYFINKIKAKQQKQYQSFTKQGVLKIIINSLYLLISPVMATTTLYLGSLMGYQITTAKAFLFLLIFNSVQLCITNLPSILSSLIVAYVSCQRIQQYLLSTQIDNQFIIQKQSDSKRAAQIIDGNFYLKRNQTVKNEQSDQLTKQSELQQHQSRQQCSKQQNSNLHTNYKKVLSSLNTCFQSQKLSMVIGKFGCGKTSLFYSILNQLIREPSQCSKITIYEQLAYCSQKPWLFQGTIKQNIIFYDIFDDKKLKQVVYYSCLQKDIKMMSNGLNTLVGQHGVNLSGGQKARICLARALYTNRDIYLFDDIFSGLDIQVGKFIIQKTIQNYLKGKTIIMAISDTKYLKLTKIDKLYQIKNMGIAQVQYNSQKIQTLRSHQQYDLQKQKQNLAQKTENFNNQQPIGHMSLSDKICKGDIQVSLYYQLLKLNGGALYVLSIILTLGCWSVLTFITNLQIKQWSQDPQKSNVYLFLYIGFALISVVLVTLYYIIELISQLRKNKEVHDRIINSVIHASLTQFFHQVPSGQILNRLTNDLMQIDFHNLKYFQPAIKYIFEFISSIIACVYTSSGLDLIPICLMIFIFIRTFNYFIKSQQQCVRLQRSTKSDVVTGLTQVVYGIDTIRAYKKHNQFTNKQSTKIDINKSVTITKLTIEYWFINWFLFITKFVVFCILGLCMFVFERNGPQIGILLVYFFYLYESLSYFVPYVIDCRQSMVQFQRLVDIFSIKKQKGRQVNMSNNSIMAYKHEYFNKYAIQFKDFSARYRQGLAPTLKNINLKIHKGKKIGIVGRTGAGKSSLLNCLLRILEPSQGLLNVNGKQIRDYHVEQLRNLFTIIQQQPVIINTTIKQNIDPWGVCSDEQISQKLAQFNLMELVKQKGGLNSVISKFNTSAGQKQIICICRALLKDSKIILIDQATSNIDNNSNQFIQKIIQKFSRDCTVLTIAHRLQTLKNCDQIIVMEQGKVIEWGSRNQLLKWENGIYRRMVESSDKLYLI